MPWKRKLLGLLLGCGFLLAVVGVWSLRSRRDPATKAAAHVEDTQSEHSAVSTGATGPQQHTNRLIREKSPYLLMHAHNPVDWYPWSPEAFEKARREQKPIFLSIGYYTCHWCHVMERESYSNPAIAEVMNKYFVAVKVDREERPDVDQVYISYVQATQGSAGWPLNVFLTPDLKPFFGGTYFPPDQLRKLLERIAEAWQMQRGQITEIANRATQALREFAKADAASGAGLQPALLDNAYQQIRATYDRENAGFGGAPKFPRPVTFKFLLRYYARKGQREALDMTLETLRRMARGGIHDALGGGFHRYSTDARWRVPHFEKMLYDQAQLAIAYVQAYQVTHDRLFADTARDILDFTLREMREPDGGFDSAEDADSVIPGDQRNTPGEGAYYVWTTVEIEKALGPQHARVFDFLYGVEPDGNVPTDQDVRGELRGKNVLFESHTLSEAAKHFGVTERTLAAELVEDRQTLFEVRAKRPHPPRDDKVVTAWNGLMVSALAQASQALEEPRYRDAAEAAANFIHSKLYDSASETLRRRYRAGEAGVNGFLSDYAFLISGLIDLYEANFDVHWLAWAIALQEKQDQLFWDPQQGGYFDTSRSDRALITPTRESYDGAEPAPNSVAAMNLLRLWQITDRKESKVKAEKTFGVFARRLKMSPEAMPQLAAALDFYLAKPKQIIIAGKADAPDTRAILQLVHQRYIPNKILLLADGGAGQRQLARWLPFLTGVSRKQGRATAYICENYVCKLPTADPRLVARLLDDKC